ncbi:hypothetical protein M0R45_002358 [Rubus argutus]|uniref:Uncharacterized protein n=1 Tax=Rubus argutus TaxID=59490 RepID=A0AAW1VE53_RUBAR
MPPTPWSTSSSASPSQHRSIHLLPASSSATNPHLLRHIKLAKLSARASQPSNDVAIPVRHHSPKYALSPRFSLRRRPLSSQRPSLQFTKPMSCSSDGREERRNKKQS